MQNDYEVKEQVSASKKLGKSEALKLAAEVSTVYVAQGKKVLEFKSAELDEDEYLKAALGRTGNLRAPTIRRGKKLYVGFPKEGFEGLK